MPKQPFRSQEQTTKIPTMEWVISRAGAGVEKWESQW